jgi:futalosine hydrolase
MHILLVAATPFEISPTTSWLAENFKANEGGSYRKGALRVDVLISGVGLPIAAFQLATVLAKRKYELVIQAGIAGALDTDLSIGQLVEVVSERFADLGAEDQDGSFLDLVDLELQERESGIFSSSGQLVNPGSAVASLGLTRVNGISVNRTSGSEKTITQLRAKYPDAQVESMEGAAFFYAALVHKVAMLQLRSISNYVEPRNKENWEIKTAIATLNATLLELLTAFEVSLEH